MKLFFYEIKKAFGYRFFTLSLAVLGIISLGTSMLSLRGTTSRLRDRNTIDAYRIYAEDSEEFKTNYEKYLALADAGAPVPEEFRYLSAVMRHASSNAAYPEKMLKLAETARRRALSLQRDGYDTGDFVYDYQKQCEGLYRHAAETVSLPTRIISGWDNYFSDEYTLYFIFAAVFLLVCTVYIPERADGIYPLIRCTKKGGGATAAAKIMTVLIISTFICFAFSGASLATVAIKLGMSPPRYPVQSLSGFEYCPYIISTGGYFLIHSLLRLAAVLIFAAFCAAVAALTRDYLFTFLGAAAFTAANIIMRTASYDSLNAPGRLFNIFSLGNCGGIFERYFAINVGGRLVQLAVFGTCVLIPAVALCTAAAFSAPAFTDAGICGRILKKLRGISAGRTKKSRVPLRHMQLLQYEAHKVLGNIGILTALALLIAARTGWAFAAYSASDDADEIFYREYMARLDGKYTEEKAQYLKDEMQSIVFAIRQYETLSDNGTDMSDDEKRELFERASYAYSHKTAAERALEYSNRISALNEFDKTHAVFLYDSGWRLIFDRHADIAALAVTVVLLCGIFGTEYRKTTSSGSFANILRATPCGRKKTFAAKLGFACLSTALIYVLFEMTDLILIAHFYSLPHPDTGYAVLLDPPVAGGSVRYPGISLAAFAACANALRFAATLFAAVMVFALSALIGKSITVMLTAALLFALPAALSKSRGLAFMAKIDILNAAAGGELLRISEAENPQHPLRYAALTVAVMLFISVLLTAAARRKWCHESEVGK